MLFKSKLVHRSVSVIAKRSMIITCLFSALLGSSPLAIAQPPLEVDEAMLHEVFRGADSFSEKEGSPPIYKAYRDNPETPEPEVIGYLFETPDWPPEEIGYSGPIDVLVGMDLKGTIADIKVLYYLESYKSIRGDLSLIHI